MICAKYEGIMNTNLMIGNKIKVKECTKCPDNKFLDIGGWQGIITDIIEEDKILVLIEWDDITLQNMPQYFVDQGNEEDLDNTKMYLYDEDVRLLE